MIVLSICGGTRRNSGVGTPHRTAICPDCGLTLARTAQAGYAKIRLHPATPYGCRGHSRSGNERTRAWMAAWPGGAHAVRDACTITTALQFRCDARTVIQ